jgi:hypothetical protein
MFIYSEDVTGFITRINAVVVSKGPTKEINAHFVVKNCLKSW